VTILHTIQYFEGKRDVILFAIDCSPSMLELRDDPNYEDVKTCHLLSALEAAMQVEKKKVVVGPNDSVGIMLFNTVSALPHPTSPSSPPPPSFGRRQWLCACAYCAIIMNFISLYCVTRLLEDTQKRGQRARRRYQKE
jgi:hypothetical protein